MRYSVILADPPWRFADCGSRIAPDHKQRHYATMTLADVKAAGVFVQQLAADDAFLFLWAPNALVCDGTASSVVAAWGFVAKQLIPWIKLTRAGKPAIGMGHYTRVCSEQLILARRGRPKVAARNVPGVVLAPRGRHSAKPEASYELIDALCGDVPKLELYARRRYSASWCAWGNQLEARPGESE